MFRTLIIILITFILLGCNLKEPNPSLSCRNSNVGEYPWISTDQFTMTKNTDDKYIYSNDDGAGGIWTLTIDKTLLIGTMEAKLKDSDGKTSVLVTPYICKQ